MTTHPQTVTGERTAARVRQIVDVPTSQKSQWPSQNRFVVQAWSNVDGWQDTKYGAQLKGAARTRAEILLDQDSSWMGEYRMVRIVPAISLKQ